MRPSEVPQEWVEAGAMGVHDWTCADSLGDGPSGRDIEAAAAALAAVIPRIRAAALRDHAADAYKIDRTAPEAINAWLLRAARQEEQR